MLWCQPLLALDLGALPSRGDVLFVPGCVCVCRSNCRNRLELEQEAEGKPGYTRFLEEVAAFLPIHEEAKGKGGSGPLPPYHTRLGQFGETRLP